MFNRKKGLFIVTAMAALVIASVVRIGQAQKSPPPRPLSAGHAQLASKVAIVGRAVGFAETRPVRELMAKAGQVDRELQEENEEINELNMVIKRKPNPHCASPKGRRPAVILWTGRPVQVEHPGSHRRLRGRRPRTVSRRLIRRARSVRTTTCKLSTPQKFRSLTKPAWHAVRRLI